MTLLPVDEQIAYLKKGLVEVIREEELRERIMTGRPLKVKVGFDPTAVAASRGGRSRLLPVRRYAATLHPCP